MNIYQRLHAVMKDVSYVQKESKKVNNQYTFVSHDAVTARVRTALVTHGVVAITRVLNHSQDGNRTNVDIEVDFVNIEEPEEKVTVPCFGYGIDQQDKGPGKGISYAVKYAFLKTFCLETGDDPERDNINHVDARKAAHDQAVVENQASINVIKDAISTGEFGPGAEAWFELDKTAKEDLWLAPTKGGIFTTSERKTMQSKEWKESYYVTTEVTE